MPEAVDLSIDQISEGLSDVMVVRLDDETVARFCSLSGDYSPVHTDANFAKARGFAAPIAHGVLLLSFVSQFIGLRLPGRHGVLRKIDFEFRKPVYAPCDIQIRGMVVSTHKGLRLVIVRFEISNSSSGLCARGTAESVLDR